MLVRKRDAQTRSQVARQKTVTEIRSEVAKKSTPYHAVSIKFATSACRAARDMAGRRFLSGAAPRLPLPDCDVLECKCRFVHHADRRSGTDRRSQFQGGLKLTDTNTFERERRREPDRRAPGNLDDELR